MLGIYKCWGDGRVLGMTGNNWTNCLHIPNRIMSELFALQTIMQMLAV